VVVRERHAIEAERELSRAAVQSLAAKVRVIHGGAYRWSRSRQSRPVDNAFWPRAAV